MAAKARECTNQLEQLVRLVAVAHKQYSRSLRYVAASEAHCQKILLHLMKLMYEREIEVRDFYEAGAGTDTNEMVCEVTR